MPTNKYSPVPGSHKTPYICKAPPKVPYKIIVAWLDTKALITSQRGRFFPLYVRRIPPTLIVPQGRYYYPWNVRPLGPDEFYEWESQVEIFTVGPPGKGPVRVQVTWHDGVEAWATLPCVSFW